MPCLAVCALVALSGAALAQDNWREAASIQPPATFSLDQLQTFDVAPNSSLVFGVDPATLTIGADGVVRYVVVIRSPSGALNVFFEGIHCRTGEMKTYANWDRDSAWTLSKNPQWQKLSAMSSTQHSARLARDSICDGPSPNGTTKNMLRTMQYGKSLRFE